MHSNVRKGQTWNNLMKMMGQGQQRINDLYLAASLAMLQLSRINGQKHTSVMATLEQDIGNGLH